MKIILRAVLLFLLALLNAQCGGGSSTKNFDVTIAPLKPFVIQSDFTFKDIDGNDVTFKAPWIRFTLNIVNNTGKDTVIANIKFNAKASRTKINSANIYIDFSGLPQTIDMNRDGTIDSGDGQRVYFAALAAGATYNSGETFILHSLPQLESGEVFLFTGTVEAWEGTVYNPEKSVSSTFHFSTSQ